MATVVKRGKATVEGTAFTSDVIVYPIAQSMRFTTNFEEEIVKDERGFDAAWLGRNLHYTADLGMKLCGTSVANAIAGAALLAPFAAVILTVTDLTANGDVSGKYQVVPGQNVDLGNTKVGDVNFMLRKYADGTQNTLAHTTAT